MGANPAAHVSIYEDIERHTDEEVAKTRDETASKSVGLERPGTAPTHTHTQSPPSSQPCQHPGLDFQPPEPGDSTFLS